MRFLPNVAIVFTCTFMCTHAWTMQCLFGTREKSAKISVNDAIRILQLETGDEVYFYDEPKKSLQAGRAACSSLKGFTPSGDIVMNGVTYQDWPLETAAVVKDISPILKIEMAVYDERGRSGKVKAFFGDGAVLITLDRPERVYRHEKWQQLEHARVFNAQPLMERP